MAWWRGGPEAPTHYKKITTLAEQAFPGYSLSCLVEYGVYELATSIAANP